METLPLMTKKQKAVYEVYLKADVVLTYAEVGKILGITQSVVFNHVRNLAKKGYLLASSKSEGLPVRTLTRSI